MIFKTEVVNDEPRYVINIGPSWAWPLEMIVANNAKQAESVTEEEKVGSWQITADSRVDIRIQDNSEKLSLCLSGMLVPKRRRRAKYIINRIYPDHAARPSSKPSYECIRQYIYDAVAEYRVAQFDQGHADSVRRMKDVLLRADANRVENLDAPCGFGHREPKLATG